MVGPFRIAPRSRQGRGARPTVAVVAGALAAVLVASVAGATSVVGPSVRVAPPTDAGATPAATLSGVACWTTTSCTAVGAYDNATSNGVPMAASGTETSWSRAVGIDLPKNHATSLSASGLDAVACPGPTTCVAVGSYEDTTPAVLPIVATESASKWATAVAVKLPAAAGGNQLSQLTSVSCVAVGTCVAVGSFSDKKSRPEVMEATESAGSWGQAAQLTLPADAGTVQHALGNVELSGVSCTDAADCVAVGSYLNRAGAIVPMRVTESAGSWGAAVRSAMPPHTPAVTSAELYSVSCVATGSCVAVGYFTNAGSRIAPVVETETAGKWAGIVPIGLPAMSPPATGGSLSGISCTAVATCTVAGDLTLSSGDTVPDVVVDVAGHWQPIQRVTSVPSGIAHPKSALLRSVACPGANTCVAVGSLYAISSKGFVVNAEAMATPITPVRPVVNPSPPTAVTAVPRPTSTVVTWHAGDDGGSPVTSFTATASPGTGSCTASTTTCTIAGLTNGTHYTVSVTATNVHGTSAPSAPSAVVVPGTPPTTPSGVQVATAHLRAAVRWHASTGSPGDPVTRYLVTAATTKGPTRTCVAAALTCTVTGLTAGDVYAVTVVAQSAVGRSPVSAAKRFRAV